MSESQERQDRDLTKTSLRKLEERKLKQIQWEKDKLTTFQMWAILVRRMEDLRQSNENVNREWNQCVELRNSLIEFYKQMGFIEEEEYNKLKKANI